MFLPLLGLGTSIFFLALGMGGKKKKSKPLEIEAGELDEHADDEPGEILVSDGSGAVSVVPQSYDDIVSHLDDAEPTVVTGALDDIAAQNPGHVVIADGEEVNVIPAEEVLPVVEAEAPIQEVPMIVEPWGNDESTDESDLVIPEVVDEQSPDAIIAAPEAGQEASEAGDGVEASALSYELLDLLLEAEAESDWQSLFEDEVANWQQEQGLEVDGKFGPKSALRLASIVGIAPIVRRWPAGSWPGSPVYQEYLAALDAAGVDRARESGQGYGGKKISKLYVEN